MLEGSKALHFKKLIFVFSFLFLLRTLDVFMHQVNKHKSAALNYFSSNKTEEKKEGEW